MSRRLMLRNASGGGGSLPSEYQQVEWIQNPNNRYINTDCYVSVNDKITLIFQQSKTPGLYDILFGSQYNNTSVDRTWFGYRKTSVVCSWCGNNSSAISNTSDLLTHTLVASKDGFFLDGNLVYTPGSANAGSKRPIYLFCNNYSTHGRDFPASGLRVLMFKIESDGGNKLDYIPCVRKLDNIAGVYDFVTGSFLSGVGSAANFIAGGNV